MRFTYVPTSMFEDQLGFEKEKLSPVVVVSTAILIALFALGFLYFLLGLVL